MAFPTAYDRALSRIRNVFPDAAKIKLEAAEVALREIGVEEEQIHWVIPCKSDDELIGLVGKG